MTAQEIRVGSRVQVDGEWLTVRSVWPEGNRIRVLYWERTEPVYYQPGEVVG